MLPLPPCPKCEDLRHIANENGDWVRCSCLLEYEIAKKMGSFREIQLLDKPSPFQKLLGKGAFFKGESGKDGGASSLAKFRSHIARILKDTGAKEPCVEINAYDLISMYFDETDKSHRRLQALVYPPWLLILLGEGNEVNNKLLPELLEGTVTSRTPPRFTWIYTRKHDAFLNERYGSSFYDWIMTLPKGTVTP